MADRAGDRASIAGAAAAALEAAARSGEAPFEALVGFDGFIDEITEVVDYRRDMSPRGYERLTTIGAFAARIAGAAGRSANIELVVNEHRFGGNGPLLASALGRLGAAVTFIGAVGREDEPTAPHPVYADLARRCRRVVPVGPPGVTRALEFHDGKIMLNEPSNVQRVTWARLVEVVGLAALREAVERASLVGIVNWSLLGGVEGIWEGLMSDVLPAIDGSRARRVLIDLSDPAKRTDADLRRAMSILSRLNGHLPVTLGVNLAEAERLDRVCGTGAFDDGGPPHAAVERAATRLRERLRLDTVVVHPREGAGAAAIVDGRVRSAWFDGPFTRSPRLSTGAGDHFNGGFAFAQVLGLPLEQCLAVGCATSGAYVRDAGAPGPDRLAAFLRALPEPEPADPSP